MHCRAVVFVTGITNLQSADYDICLVTYTVTVSKSGNVILQSIINTMIHQTLHFVFNAEID